MLMWGRLGPHDLLGVDLDDVLEGSDVVDVVAPRSNWQANFTMPLFTEEQRKIESDEFYRECACARIAAEKQKQREAVMRATANAGLKPKQTPTPVQVTTPRPNAVLELAFNLVRRDHKASISLGNDNVEWFCAAVQGAGLRIACVPVGPNSTRVDIRP